MKILKSLPVFILTLFLCSVAFSQTLFPEKMKIRTTHDYCIDCGNPKAYADQFTLDYISDVINRRYRFGPGTNTVTFQVLVDASGFNSVISYNDPSNSGLTWDIIRLLNGSLWKPAKENGKRISSAVNVVFTIANGKVSGHMQAVERDELAELEPAGDPTIYNKTYKYKNPNIDKYDFESWNRFDSMMPDNVCEALQVDKTDVLWLGTAKGLTRFDGTSFVNVNENNSPLKTTSIVNTIATDKNNDTWMAADKNIYRYNHNGGWLLFDSTNFKIAGASHIIINPSGEVFFTSSKGLQIVRNDKVRLMDKQFLDMLPSEDVRYAYFDTKERLWIGTSKGNIMIDKKRKITVFNTDKANSPLKNTVITNITEDDKGNLYFALEAIDKTTNESDQEGLAVLNGNAWSFYNDKNSGMPSNRINSLLFDKAERALWIGTPISGLVRFDLKTNIWENYNNHNSNMPSYNIADLSMDSKGNIYAATSNGLLRLKKH